MQTVPVSASSRSYDIHIGSGLLEQCPALLAPLFSPRRCAVVTDDNVAALYLTRLTNALTAAGWPQPCTFVFPHGEESKSLATAGRLYEFLAEEKLTRSDLILALGGGVTGDLAGFAASTYLRGVRYVQIPTTLLAQVDSSVGGKTAVDLPQGKNLVGTFCQPSLVLCDISLLSTLTDDIFLDGMAEVLKYGLIRDRALYEQLTEPDGAYRAHMEDIVKTCVSIKRDIVQHDEFDTGERMLLNFGHTLGHAVEAHSGYTVAHGRAVAIGMAMISRMAARAGLVEPQLAERIVFGCRQLGLPVSYDAPPAVLAEHCLSDKKRGGDSISVILPKELGEAVIHRMSVHDFTQMVCGGDV